MGCAASQPEEASQPKASDVTSSEMEAVRAKLAEQKRKEEETGTTGMKRSKTFKRKFNGFQAGGGSRHDVKRHVDMSPEAVAEREAVKALMKKKQEEKEAKMNFVERSLTRASRSSMNLIRSSTRASFSENSGSFSSASTSFVRKFTRNLSRRLRSSRSSSHVPADVHNHAGEEGGEGGGVEPPKLSKKASSNKSARFADNVIDTMEA